MSDTGKGGLYYGWVIVGAAFFIAMLTYASGFTFGVFLSSFRETLQASSAAVSGAYALSLFLYTGLAPFTGWAVDKYGPRTITLFGGVSVLAGLLVTRQTTALWHLYAGYGLLGIGMSAAYTPLMTTTSRWFARNRGLAVGIVSAGIGAGPLVMAPLARSLISAYDWRFAFLVMTWASSLILPLAFLLKRSPATAPVAPLPGRAGAPTAGLRDFSLKEAARTPAFWLIAFMFFGVGTGLQMVNAHIVVYSEVKGLSPLLAAAVLSTVSGASMVGKISTGVISDRLGRQGTLGISILLEGIMILGMIAAPGAAPLFAAAVLFGLGYGGHSTQFPPLISEMLGLKYMGSLLGATVFFWGIGGAIGPVLAGRIYDLTGDYASGFLIGSLVMLSAAVACFFVRSPQKKG